MPLTQVNRQLDITGKICPYTLMETRDTLKELVSGEVLEVLVDFEPAAMITIPNFCAKKGYPFWTIPEGEGRWRIRIERTD
ncbi:MAG: sulfurtransferase TusA family protein [Chloroflexota bacterium]|nr:sulfurtransferase TusA family protein [Chloroflexota bacterium]